MSIEPRHGEACIRCAHDVPSLAVPPIEDTGSGNLVRGLKELEDRTIGLGDADFACDEDMIEVRFKIEVSDFLALVL
jgi:hypothetical protein